MQLTNIYKNTHATIENGNMQDTKSLLLSSKYDWEKYTKISSDNCDTYKKCAVLISYGNITD